MIRYFFLIGLFFLSLSANAARVVRLVVSPVQIDQSLRALSSLCNGSQKVFVENPSYSGSEPKVLQVTSGSSSPQVFGSRRVAFWCSDNFRGTYANAVSFVVGGDFGAIGLSVGNQRDRFIDIDPVAGGAVTTSVALADGGFIDFEPQAFGFEVLGDYGVPAYPSTSYVSRATIYGVVVSGKLYVDLQKAQGLSGCGVNDLIPACQPSISRASYASIVSDVFNTSKQNVNASLGVGTSQDQLTLCRFSKYFGLERAVDEYFLRATSGSDGYFGGSTGSASADLYASANSGLNEFNLVEVNDASSFDACISRVGYAIGVMPMTRFPMIRPDSGSQLIVWRYVKLNDVAIFDGLNGDAKSARDGRYDFWFYGSKFSSTILGGMVINAIDSELANLPLARGFLPSANVFDRAHNFAPVMRN